MSASLFCEIFDRLFTRPPKEKEFPLTGNTLTDLETILLRSGYEMTPNGGVRSEMEIGEHLLRSYKARTVFPYQGWTIIKPKPHRLFVCSLDFRKESTHHGSLALVIEMSEGGDYHPVKMDDFVRELSVKRQTVIDYFTTKKSEALIRQSIHSNFSRSDFLPPPHLANGLIPR